MVDKIAEMLGLTQADIDAYEATPRTCCGQTHGELTEWRRCEHGCCTLEYCQCGTWTGAACGPAGTVHEPSEGSDPDDR